MRNSQFDERDIQFSRMKLKIGTERFTEYYGRNPDKKDKDDKIRQNAGLLSSNSVFYHPFNFAIAKANFKVIETLYPLVTSTLINERQKVETKGLMSYIKSFAKLSGAHSVGVCELKDYHKYSYMGQPDRYGQVVENEHSYAIAITSEMDIRNTQSAPASPIIFESSFQYLKVGVIALQIAEFLRNLGFEARAHIDANYQIICPLVARDAGLGEIGRMGLLMTPLLGARVRIAVVTTNAPLQTTEYKPNNAIIDFCGYCKKCADSCPAKSIPNGNRQSIDGSLRWKINSDSCYNYWTIAGTDCGRCLAVCPFSHSNNFLHNLVRKGIQFSSTFARFAYKLDNIIYKKKTKPKPIPVWMGE